MVSEVRKQSMAWMEMDYSKHTYFRWIKWRLEHLGTLGTMGKVAPLNRLPVVPFLAVIADHSSTQWTLQSFFAVQRVNQWRCAVLDSLTGNSPDPVVCVPVIYFIGDAGLPLEVVGGAVSVDEFVSKATAAFEVYTEKECLCKSKRLHLGVWFMFFCMRTEISL